MEELNILSLFDGLSCGQIALNRVGIKYNKYYASELNKYAKAITRWNYPDTIQLGNVRFVKGKDLPEIYLLMGGSPCQGFSISGRQLNFYDSRSRLFFEYIRILKEIKPKYFLLENVVMRKEFQDIITQYIGVEPIKIDSALVSAQHRRRLYWTNIPNIKQPKDKKLLFKDVREPTRYDYIWSKERFRKFLNKEYKFNSTYKLVLPDKKAHTICKSDGSERPKEKYQNTLRELNCVELERLQTIPDNYTHGISGSQRRKLLGDAWTVDVIVHLLKNLKEENK